MSPQITDERAIKKIEAAGSEWGHICVNSVMKTEDLQWWATKYKPFNDYLREVDGVKRCFIEDFDPHSAHPLAKTLFAPAWGTHGACWVSPAMSPTGRVPDFRFAAFERGVIQAIRHAWNHYEGVSPGGRAE